MRLWRILVLTGLAALLVLSLLWWGCGPVEPSDHLLALRFRVQRRGLERLVTMSDEDRQMSRIAPDFLWTQDRLQWPRPESEWGISEARWDDYRKLFRQAHFPGGVIRGTTDTKVIVWVWGIVAGGVSVSYLHCGSPQNKSAPESPACAERKDAGAGMYGNSTSYGYHYKKLTDDWYILEESN
jgi:hypothetical protein